MEQPTEPPKPTKTSARRETAQLVDNLLPEADVRGEIGRFIDITQPMAGNTMIHRLEGGVRILADTVLYDIGEYGNAGVTGLDLMTLGSVLGKRREQFKKSLEPRKRQKIPTYSIDRTTNYGGFDWDLLFPMLTKAGLRIIPSTNLPKDFSGIPEAFDLYSASIELQEEHYPALSDRSVVKYYPPNDPFGALIVADGKLESETQREQRIAKAAKAQTPWHEIDIQDGTLTISLANQTFYRPQQDSTTPKYIPAYQTVQPDNGMLTAVQLSAEVATGDVRSDWIRLAKEMADVTVEYALSSGTMAGQIGRMAKGVTMLNEVQAKLKQRGLTARKIDYQEYRTLIKASWPLEDIEPNKQFNTTNLFVLDAVFRVMGYDLLKINSTAGAGRYYGGKVTRDESTFTDYMMATNILQHCTELDTPTKALEYYNMRRGMFLPNLKNKMEILPRASIKTKSRNYFHFNTYVQLPAQILFSHFQKKSGHYNPKSSTNPKSLSIFGWAPQNGGLQDLLKTMSTEADDSGFSLAVYSDNLWCLLKPPGWAVGDPFTWFSLDGSSMESSNTQGTMYLLNSLIAERIPMSKAWRNYILNLHPIISTNVFAVLGKTAILQPGLASGTSATAQNNHSLMLLCALAVTQVLRLRGTGGFLSASGWSKIKAAPTGVIGDASILHPDIENEFLKLQVSIKVEMYTTSTLFPFLLGKAIPPAPGTIPLDLLGQDAASMIGVWPSMEEIHPLFPVLDRGRLVRASVYDSLSLRWKQDSLFTNVVRSMRLKALYTLGGWWYDVLGLLFRQRLSALTPEDLQSAPDEESWKAFQYQIRDLVSSLVEEEVADATIAQLMYATLRSMTIPYMMDVVKLNLGKKYAMFLGLELLQENGLEEALRYAGPLELTILLSAIPKTADMSWRTVELTTEIEKFMSIVEKSPSEEGLKKVVRALKQQELNSVMLPLRLELQRKKRLLIDDDVPDPFNFYPRGKEGEYIPIEETEPTFDDIEFGPIPDFVSPRDWQTLRTKIPKPPTRPLKNPMLPQLERAILMEAAKPESFLYGTENLTKKLARVGFAPKGAVPPKFMGYLALYVERAMRVGQLLHDKAGSPAKLGDFMVKETRLARKAAKKEEKAQQKLKKADRRQAEAEDRKAAFKPDVSDVKRPLPQLKAQKETPLPIAEETIVFQVPRSIYDQAKKLLRKVNVPNSLSPEEERRSHKLVQTFQVKLLNPVPLEARMKNKFTDAGLGTIIWEDFPDDSGYSAKYLQSLWALASELASGGGDSRTIIHAHFSL